VTHQYLFVLGKETPLLRDFKALRVSEGRKKGRKEGRKEERKN
jgi:hypothetical protein